MSVFSRYTALDLMSPDCRNNTRAPCPAEMMLLKLLTNSSSKAPVKHTLVTFVHGQLQPMFGAEDHKP